MGSLTPDACMSNTWDEMGSRGKRERNDESTEEKSSQPTTTSALQLCDSNKKPALEVAIGPKNLRMLIGSEPVLPPEAGGGDKNPEITGASAQQLSQTAAETEALSKGSTTIEQIQNTLNGLTKEEMSDMGYDLDTMQKFSASVAAGPKALPVLVLKQEGKFNIDIFSEEMHEKLCKALVVSLENETVKVGIFKQMNCNGKWNTVLTVECSERVYDYYYGKTINYTEDETLIKFKGTSLTEWLGEVGKIEYLGMTYAFNLGPMPRAPTDDTIKVMAPLLAMYVHHLLRRPDHHGRRRLGQHDHAPLPQADPALRRRRLRGQARPDPQHPPHGGAVLLFLPGHRRLPLGRVRDQQGEAGGLPRAQEEARREEQGDADQADQADPARHQRRPARGRAHDPQGEQDDLGAWGEARGRYINP